MENSGRVLPLFFLITLMVFAPARADSDDPVEFGNWWLEAADWAGIDPSEVEDRTGDYPLYPIKSARRCTFAFNAGPVVLDALHEDGECQERNLGRHGGDYDLYVQRLRYVHIPAASLCGGGPGDTTGWRACARDKHGNPIPIGFKFPMTECSADARGTGPNGCHTCQRIITCH